jgi:5-methylcytosine-specific restriction endonuclease McrA
MKTFIRKNKRSLYECKQAASLTFNLANKYMPNTIYAEKLLSKMWKTKREEILQRDNRKCCNCGSASNLQVHHRQYHINVKTGTKREPWDYKNNYLVTLCNSCHENGHKQYNIPIFKN